MELRVVLGDHEVMCEFSSEPKLAALHTAVRKALGLDEEASTKFGMKLMPEGLLLSDDSSVAALSSGSTIEVLPDERDAAVLTLQDQGVSLSSKTPDLMQAVERGDTETVRLMLLAWGDSLSDGFLWHTVHAAVTAAVDKSNLPVCRVMFADKKCIPLIHDVRGKRWHEIPQYHGRLQKRDFVQALAEHGVTGFSSRFFSDAVDFDRDWVFTELVPQGPTMLRQTLGSAVNKNKVSIVRAIASHGTLQQSWLTDALLYAVLQQYSDNTDVCHLLVELGAEVPRNVSLLKATCLGFFDVLIEHGADANAADGTGKTCLMRVCAQGECLPVAILLDHGVDLDATDGEGATALWYASTKEVLMLLVQRGAAINIRDGKGDWFPHCLYRKVQQIQGAMTQDPTYPIQFRPGYHYPGEQRHQNQKRLKSDLQMLEALVAEPRLDVNVVDSTGCTVLMRTAQLEYSVAFFLQRADIDVGAQDSDGMTCLLHAASAKRLVACNDILAYLKAAKRTADVTVQDCNGWTCLMHAVSEANRDVFPRPEQAHEVCAQLVVSLASHGADLCAHNGDGLTALHIAVGSKSEDAFAALLAAGACPNAGNREGLPLLHTVVTKSLALFGALNASPKLDRDARDRNGRTALMRVPRSNGLARCTALLEKGADVGAQDNDGRTCLGHAAASGDVKVVTLLLDHGASINDGAVPPLLAAVLAAKVPVCLVLLERGADATKPAADGRTCMSVATGLKGRGAKAVLALMQDALGDSDSAESEADATQAGEEAPASGSSKRKRDHDDEHPAGSTHACAVCGAVALASGEPFPSAESVLRHASSKHRMRRSEYTRRFGE